MVDDDGQLGRKARVIGSAVGNGCGHQVAGAVLMLQAFTAKRGSTGRGTQQKATCTLVSSGPYLVADALKAKHGVIDIKGQHRQAVHAVAGGGRRPAGQRTGFADAFLQNLPVQCFTVAEHRANVFRRIALAHAGVNADLLEQIGHAEGARFVGHDGHNLRAQCRVFQQAAQHAHKGHGGAHLFAASSERKARI